MVFVCFTQLIQKSLSILSKLLKGSNQTLHFFCMENPRYSYRFHIITNSKQTCWCDFASWNRCIQWDGFPRKPFWIDNLKTWEFTFFLIAWDFWESSRKNSFFNFCELLYFVTISVACNIRWFGTTAENKFVNIEDLIHVRELCTRKISFWIRAHTFRWEYVVTNPSIRATCDMHHSWSFLRFCGIEVKN